MRILLYGDAYPTELAERALEIEGHTIVGHVPCLNPSFPGEMQSQPVGSAHVHTVYYDLALSVLYDRKIIRLDKAYNIHPGLLPRWAGCDILYHTVRENARRQGLTLHRVSREFDRGPIVSRISYPVYPGDRIVDLYKRVCALMPGFAVASVKLIEAMAFMYPPPPDDSKITYYKRGQIAAAPILYTEAAIEIGTWIKEQREADNHP